MLGTVVLRPGAEVAPVSVSEATVHRLVFLGYLSETAAGWWAKDRD